jgi:2-hydroxy-6-oxonona-2,4-dienedioate hydrolase
MPGTDPETFVANIDARSARRHTRSAGGSMVWRTWGEGRTLLLLHGASGSWTHWIRNILPLAEHFQVLAPDMPGFGDSDALPEPHTADRLADDVAAGLGEILPAPAELDLAGFSFGGIIAGLVAARLGLRVRTLVLLGAGGLDLPFPPLPPLLRIEPDASPEEARRGHRENLHRLMIARAERVDDLALFLQVDNLRRARFRSGSIPTSDALQRALPSVRARITGIWGSRDAFVGPYVEDRRRLLASFERTLDFRVIEGAGHWTTYEAAHDVNAILLDMLREPSGPSARSD